MAPDVGVKFEALRLALAGGLLPPLSCADVSGKFHFLVAGVFFKPVPLGSSVRLSNPIDIGSITD
jgi:hypothetical protein